MAEGTATWRVGEVIDGRYQVSQVHRQGGMGVVYRVRHLGWGIDLAVKSPRPDLFRSTEGRRQFVAEAETWVSLGLHPHVCNCYYVRVLDGMPRVFAEYIPGGSLHEWINGRRLYAGKPLAVLARILDIAIQTAWGLDHAHGQGLVHRDVKPGNMLLDSESGKHGTVTAKITDFGLARARQLAATASPDTPLDASVLVPGGSGMTPCYASPEQTGRKAVGWGTDIYSFAVSVLEMCAGEVTWMAGPAAGAALAGYRADDAVGAVTIPSTLGDLLQQCLSEYPKDRPKSMADVAAMLIDIYQDVTGEAYPRPVPVAADLLTDEFNNRAVSLLDLDRHAEADQAFSQALAADPQNARAIYNAGLARWRRGDVTDVEFIAEIEAVRADAGDPWEARYALVQIHLERGDLGTARAFLSELARQRPDELEVLAALRRIHSGEIIDARCVREWQVSWSPRPPSEGLWVQATTTVPDLVPFALTPNGRLMVVGGWDGTVRLYDVHSGQCVRTVKGHRRPVLAVDLTPDGRFAVSVCEDETVRFWDLTKRRFRGSASGRRLYASPNPPDPPSRTHDYRPRSGDTAIRLTDDGCLALYTDRNGVFHVWDTRSEQTMVHDESRADRLVEVSADGRWALSLRSLRLGHDREDAVRLWNLLSGRCVRELLPGHKPTVTAMCFSADGRYAATGGYDDIRVWDLDDGRCVHVLASDSAPNTLSLSADARFLLSGSQYENAIRLWELDCGRCLRTFQAHQGGTSVVRLDADSRFALSVGQDRMVRRWALPGDHRVAALLSRPRTHVDLTQLGGRVDALVTSAEREMTAGRFPVALDLLRQARAIEGYERAPRVMSAWWALGHCAVRTELRAVWSSRCFTGQAEELQAVDLTGDGKIAVTGDRDGTVAVWDLDGGRRLRVLEGHELMVESVRLSSDGQWALSSSRDRTVRLWDVGNGRCRHILTVTDRGLDRSLPARFSADGTHAMVGGDNGRIQLWDLRTGNLAGQLKGTGADFVDLCVGDDGRQVAVTRRDRAELWDLVDGRTVHRVDGGFVPRTRSVSLSADGRFALSGADGVLRLWDTRTGDVVRRLDGPPLRGFHTVRMTADGRFAMAGGYWSPPAVWDVRSGRCIRVLDGHEPGASSLALTPDGRFLLTAMNDVLRCWELDWELEARDAADWDDGAAPYLEAFLHCYGPEWTDTDLDVLLRRLQNVGYGWLRADGVRAQLNRMAL